MYYDAVFVLDGDGHTTHPVTQREHPQSPAEIYERGSIFPTNTNTWHRKAKGVLGRNNK